MNKNVSYKRKTPHLHKLSLCKKNKKTKQNKKQKKTEGAISKSCRDLLWAIKQTLRLMIPLYNYLGLIMQKTLNEHSE